MNALLIILSLLLPAAFARPSAQPREGAAADAFCGGVTRPCIDHPPRATITTSTPFGPAIGQLNANGVTRYSVKYASATRWAQAVMLRTWTSPNPSSPTSLPLACPQSTSVLPASQFTEDCLDLVLYVPATAATTPGGVPSIIWIHGGSFVEGSATAPGLDGSNLAIATNAIVAVIQYRLGVLGLLPPFNSSSTQDLAVQDTILAMNFLRTVLPSFGGTAQTPRLTIAGQSSGASMVRALLGTPSASALFYAAWMHSDSMDYGFLTAGALNSLRSAWSTELGCGSATATCAQTMSLDVLLAHQDNLLNASSYMGGEFFAAEPLRPSPSGPYIDETFTSASEFPPASGLKPLVVTTVKDEAAFTIYGMFNESLSVDDYHEAVEEGFGEPRASTLLNSSFYKPTDPTDTRPPLQVMGTDQVFRCPSWDLARGFAQHRGSSAQQQFVGVFTVGASYPGNEIVPQCTVPGVVCHQDDIEILFGTTSNPTPAQTSLTLEVQARYAAFIRTGSPNAMGFATWSPAGTSDVRALNLGAQNGSVFPAGACVPGFWGSSVQYDYQVLGE